MSAVYDFCVCTCRRCLQATVLFHSLVLSFEAKATNIRLRPRSTLHTHTQPFYGFMDFVRFNQGEPVPEETFTHSHLLWSSICLSASSVYCNPWHPPCSVHVPDSLFPQSLSKFSLVSLLAWHPPLHAPYISSPNHCLLLATHAHTIATCFAVVPTSTLHSDRISCEILRAFLCTSVCLLQFGITCYDWLFMCLYSRGSKIKTGWNSSCWRESVDMSLWRWLCSCSRSHCRPTPTSQVSPQCFRLSISLFAFHLPTSIFQLKLVPE